MPLRSAPLLSGGYAYLCNRGSNRQHVFVSPDSYAVFLTPLRDQLPGEERDARRQSS